MDTLNQKKGQKPPRFFFLGNTSLQTFSHDSAQKKVQVQVRKLWFQCPSSRLHWYPSGL